MTIKGVSSWTSRKSLCLALVLGLGLVSVLGTAMWRRSQLVNDRVAAIQPDAVTKARLKEAYGQLPLSFEANVGQADPQVDFISRGSGYTLFLTPREAMLTLSDAALRMKFLGSETKPRAVG